MKVFPKEEMKLYQGFIGCVFLLYMAILKVLMIPKRTYLTINDDRIIVYDKRGQGENRFSEVEYFERETTRLCTFRNLVRLTDGIMDDAYDVAYCLIPSSLPRYTHVSLVR